MHITAIVLAAGRGLRLSRFNRFTVRGGIPTHISKMIGSGRSKIPKPLIEINSQPIIIYSLNTLSQHPDIRDIIVVANADNLKDIVNKIKQYGISKIRDIILGGRERRDSVSSGLDAIDNRTELVLIHDAVRPFIDREIISSLIKEAKESGAAIIGVPVKATIKKVTSHKSQVTSRVFVKETVNRDNLWEIQTPQVFKKELILKAYKKFGNVDATDDAMLVERLGVKVSVVFGSYNNIKITTPEDLVLAEAISKIKKG